MRLSCSRWATVQACGLLLLAFAGATHARLLTGVVVGAGVEADTEELYGEDRVAANTSLSITAQPDAGLSADEAAANDTGATHPADLTALLQLRKVLMPLPSHRQFWPVDTDPCLERTCALGSCGWPGISCSEGRVVEVHVGAHLPGLPGPMAGSLPDLPLPDQALSGLSRLVLRGQNLVGPLPGSLAMLPSLQVLDLGNNSLSGSLPESWANLSALEVLDLASNQLTGPLPLEWGEMAALAALNASRNQLSGGLPEEWEELALLEVLDISHNQLNGSLPPTWTIPRLALLDLHDNLLSGSLPAEWPLLLPQLRILDVSNNLFSDSLPAEWGSFQQLHTLQIQDNRISGPLPAEWGDMESLEVLQLRHNLISGTLPAEWGELAGLEVLDMSFNHLTGAVPEEWICGEIVQELQKLEAGGNPQLCLLQEYSCNSTMNPLGGEAAVGGEKAAPGHKAEEPESDISSGLGQQLVPFSADDNASGWQGDSSEPRSHRQGRQLGSTRRMVLQASAGPPPRQQQLTQRGQALEYRQEVSSAGGGDAEEPFTVADALRAQGLPECSDLASMVPVSPRDGDDGHLAAGDGDAAAPDTATPPPRPFLPILTSEPSGDSTGTGVAPDAELQPFIASPTPSHTRVPSWMHPFPPPGSGAGADDASGSQQSDAGGEGSTSAMTAMDVLTVIVFMLIVLSFCSALTLAGVYARTALRRRRHRRRRLANSVAGLDGGDPEEGEVRTPRVPILVVQPDEEDLSVAFRSKSGQMQHDPSVLADSCHDAVLPVGDADAAAAAAAAAAADVDAARLASDVPASRGGRLLASMQQLMQRTRLRQRAAQRTSEAALAMPQSVEMAAVPHRAGSSTAATGEAPAAAGGGSATNSGGVQGWPLALESAASASAASRSGWLVGAEQGGSEAATLSQPAEAAEWDAQAAPRWQLRPSHRKTSSAPFSSDACWSLHDSAHGLEVGPSGNSASAQPQHRPRTDSAAEGAAAAACGGSSGSGRLLLPTADVDDQELMLQPVVTPLWNSSQELPARPSSASSSAGPLGESCLLGPTEVAHLAPAMPMLDSGRQVMAWPLPEEELAAEPVGRAEALPLPVQTFRFRPPSRSDDAPTPCLAAARPGAASACPAPLQEIEPHPQQHRWAQQVGEQRGRLRRRRASEPEPEPEPELLVEVESPLSTDSVPSPGGSSRSSASSCETVAIVHQPMLHDWMLQRCAAAPAAGAAGPAAAAAAVPQLEADERVDSDDFSPAAAIASMLAERQMRPGERQRARGAAGTIKAAHGEPAPGSAQTGAFARSLRWQ